VVSAHPFAALLQRIVRIRGVTACLVVDARDGVIIDATLPVGMRGPMVAALVASLVRKTAQSARSADAGALEFMQLDAEHGCLCAVETDGIVLAAVADPRTNLARLRVELLAARALVRA